MKHKGLAKQLLVLDIPLVKSQITFLSMLMLGMLEKRTVNLKQVVTSMESDTKLESLYRRAQRFFRYIRWTPKMFMTWMLKLIDKDEYLLCVDRTNWKFGKVNINILMVAVADMGLAIPLVFILLDKQGNSNTTERVDVLQMILKAIPVDKMQALVADREFIGQVWFEFLITNNVPFAIRIKQNTLLEENLSVATLCKRLKVGQKKYIPRCSIFGLELSLAVTRSAKGELVIIASNRKPCWALNIYAERWKIESLFKALKSSGFRLEDTHLVHDERIQLLVCIVSITFVWALKVGHWVHKKKPIAIKKHGRRAISVFRLGLDNIMYAITNRHRRPDVLEGFFRILSCT